DASRSGRKQRNLSGDVGSPLSHSSCSGGSMMAAKKPTSHRAQAKAKDQAGAQSAAARRTAEAELRTLIKKFAPDHLRLIRAARRSLRQRLPAAHEIVYE